jgi:IS4 transposase
MLFKQLFDQFVRETPVTVMLRATLENSFSAEAIDKLFVETARRQRPGEVAFSAVVDLLALTVCGVRKSVNAAYLAAKDRFEVSVRSVYNKLKGVEIEVSRELVRRPATKLKAVTRELRLPKSSLFPRYRVKILDGNHLPATEHRLAELRTTRRGPLPGHALCVLEPDCRLITDVFPCEDGHAQERSLLPQVLESVQRKDLYIADRNFCVSHFLFGIAERGGFFAIRQHGSTLHWEPLKKRKLVGRIATGVLYEQTLRLTHSDGRTMKVRRITVVLDKPTENGDTEIHVLTNLPKRVSPQAVAEGYRSRWTLENAFQEIEQALQSELQTLCYPKAALLAFCLAVNMYNVLSVVKSALSKTHGEAAPREKLSGYYLAAEITASYHGMMIAVPPLVWQRRFAKLTAKSLARVLQRFARHVHPERFYKATRGPKKPYPERTTGKSHHHVSTFRLLAQRKLKSSTKS